MAETEGRHLQFQWAMKLLMKDDFFARMPVEDRSRIIGEAIKFGAHLAGKAREELGAPSGADSISQMLASLGCIIRIDEKSGLPGSLSRYEDDMSAALFFVRRIRDATSAATERGEWAAGWYELYELCIARELFHHMENTLSGKASHHVRFKDRFLGLFPVSRPVEAAREIACVVFVQDFLGLPEAPLMMRDD